MKQLAPALFILLAVAAVRAERLPIKVYTTADGLVSDRISRIVRDPRGFLWFCTEEGLSRFDGQSFTNYTTDQGLPSNWVDDLLITRAGEYLIATEAGLCRFNPNATAGVVLGSYRPGQDEIAARIKVLYEDRAGRIWCGTWNGLYRVELVTGGLKFSFVDIGMTLHPSAVVRNILEDRRGNLWVTADNGLYRIFPDGRAERYFGRQGWAAAQSLGLLEDRAGQVWAGNRRTGLCLLAPAASNQQPVVARRYTMSEGLRCNRIGALLQTSRGRFWVGTDCGLSELLLDAKGNALPIRNYLDPEFLNDLTVWCLAEDVDGNLWIGSTRGAVKMSLGGFSTFTPADGLGSVDTFSAFETQTGSLVVCSTSPANELINLFDGRRFIPIRFNLPSRLGPFAWGAHHGVLQDHLGEWWVPTQQGLYRFPKVNRVEELARVRPKQVYTMRNGLPGNAIYRLYEDGRGDLWIATDSQPRVKLTRWERATDKLHNFTVEDGLPPDKPVMCFGEDRAGNLWLGLRDGGLARYRAGRFTLFTAADGLPAGSVRDLFIDRAGRLWLASGKGGVGRVDDPGAARPQFVTVMVRDGLSSNDVWCIIDDRAGRLYIGTARGLDRLDTETGRIESLATSSGLPPRTVTFGFRDRQDALWFSTNVGLARLVPDADATRTRPAIAISGLRFGGMAQWLPALGLQDAGVFEVGPNQNNLSVDFFAISFSEPVRYQYRLENAVSDWSAPTAERTVNYPGLPPGTYRFLVQAVKADGLTGSAPATVTFTILPPVWRRWWFLTPSALLLGALVYGAYRYRVAQLIRIERVRTRIATDLHDDIGSNLSVIAGLSRVLRDQVGARDPRMSERLSVIADASSRSVEAMSDIIWAVNPQKDHLSDLSQRMRRFASDAFTARDIEFSFNAPELVNHARVDAETRRAILLIFKEAVNNAVRHSACTQASVRLEVAHGKLSLQISDNGQGFDQQAAEYGNGVLSMRRRAEKLGGKLEIASATGQGTTVLLTAPLRH